MKSLLVLFINIILASQYSLSQQEYEPHMFAKYYSPELGTNDPFYPLMEADAMISHVVLRLGEQGTSSSGLPRLNSVDQEQVDSFYEKSVEQNKYFQGKTPNGQSKFDLFFSDRARHYIKRQFSFDENSVEILKTIRRIKVLRAKPSGSEKEDEQKLKEIAELKKELVNKHNVPAKLISSRADVFEGESGEDELGVLLTIPRYAERYKTLYNAAYKSFHSSKETGHSSTKAKDLTHR